MFVMLLLCGLIGVSWGSSYDNPAYKGACLCVKVRTLNIRQGAGFTGRILGKAKKGQCFTSTNAVLIKRTKWYKIDYNGKAAWAAARYLKKGQASECQKGYGGGYGGYGKYGGGQNGGGSQYRGVNKKHGGGQYRGGSQYRGGGQYGGGRYGGGRYRGNQLGGGRYNQYGGSRYGGGRSQESQESHRKVYH